jgi:hypothetical protein
MLGNEAGTGGYNMPYPAPDLAEESEADRE